VDFLDPDSDDDGIPDIQENGEDDFPSGNDADGESQMVMSISGMYQKMTPMAMIFQIA